MTFGKLVEKIVATVGAIAVCGALFIFWLLPKVNASLPGADKVAAPGYYSVTDGTWSYKVINLVLSSSETPFSLDGSDFQPSSEDEISDRAADTAWVAASRALGCNVEFEESSDQRPEYDHLLFASLEGKELAVSGHGTSYSAGLTFALAQASYATGFAPESSIAAIGVVNRTGKVTPISDIASQIPAVIESGAEMLLVHSSNVPEARSALNGAPVEVFGVSTVSEALSSLGFPSTMECL